MKAVDSPSHNSTTNNPFSLPPPAGPLPFALDGDVVDDDDESGTPQTTSYFHLLMFSPSPASPLIAWFWFWAEEWKEEDGYEGYDKSSSSDDMTRSTRARRRTTFP